VSGDAAGCACAASEHAAHGSSNNAAEGNRICFIRSISELCGNDGVTGMRLSVRLYRYP
jgi:hypothetical protein